MLAACPLNADAASEPDERCLDSPGNNFVNAELPVTLGLET